MILVDTSVWIGHFRSHNLHLADLMDQNEAGIHPWIVGELACEYLHPRKTVLAALKRLPSVTAATEDEVLYLIETHKLIGLGIGYLDMHLLASACVHNLRLWTHDRRLHKTASTLNAVYIAP